MTVAAKRKPAKGQGRPFRDGVFDRELEDLPQELRWREWMGRIEAVLFASASAVSREDLARVVGQGRGQVDVPDKDAVCRGDQGGGRSRGSVLVLHRDGNGGALRHCLSSTDRLGGA